MPSKNPERKPSSINRGGAVPPKNPTGRLVITSLDGIKNGGASLTHWLPADGNEWECPHCGEWFTRKEGTWRATLDVAG